jgi:cathepsin B
MKSLVLLAVLLVVASANQQAREDIIAYVNGARTTWTAGVNSRFAGKDFAYTKSLLGALKGGETLPVHEITVDESAIPADFDVRTAWPACAALSGEIRDQSDCGSCWAMGAVEAATDRMCVALGGNNAPRLSEQDLLACCGFSCGMGCDGGYPSAAWSWFVRTGVVTGGPYNDRKWCSAYSLPNCDHHTTGQYQPCGATEYPTPKCTKACDANTTYTTPYNSDKKKFKTSYSVSSSVSAIQTEIQTYGSVECAMDVYADFESYKSGVYQHTTGSYLGGHAMKVMGWGTENNTPYWLVANSWNTDWGNQGYIKIIRGQDECGIESGIVAGHYN